MKVLQILLDSYYPGEDDGIDFFSTTCLDSKFEYKNTYLTEDKSRSKLISPVMWLRTLAGVEPDEAIERYNPNESNKRASQKTKYNKVPSSEWIWNKLSKQGVSSFVFPYYLLTELDASSVIEKNGNEHLVSGVLKTYNTPWYKTITKGEVEWKEGMEYSCFCEFFDKSLPEGYTRESVDEMWKSSELMKTNLVKFISDIESDLVNDKLIPQMQENKKMFETEVFAHMDEEMPENFYSFVGICETDCMSHFLVPYKGTINSLRQNYVEWLVMNLVNKIDPDIVIVHGDHNMKSTYKNGDGTIYKKAEFEYNGEVFRGRRAYHSPNCFFLDHGNKVGGVVWSKSEDVHKYLNEYFKDESKLFMDGIYDYVTLECFSKEEM